MDVDLPCPQLLVQRMVTSQHARGSLSQEQGSIYILKRDNNNNSNNDNDTSNHISRNNNGNSTNSYINSDGI